MIGRHVEVPDTLLCAGTSFNINHDLAYVRSRSDEMANEEVQMTVVIHKSI